MASSAVEMSWIAVTIMRSEEHTSELQSRLHLVCRLLLEKKKKHTQTQPSLNNFADRSTINTPLRYDPCYWKSIYTFLVVIDHHGHCLTCLCIVIQRAVRC